MKKNMEQLREKMSLYADNLRVEASKNEKISGFRELEEEEEKEMTLNILKLIRSEDVDSLQELIKDDFEDWRKPSFKNKENIVKELIRSKYIEISYTHYSILKLENYEKIVLGIDNIPKLTEKGEKYLKEINGI